VQAVSRLCELYPVICLTPEEKAWKTLGQGSRRVPVGTMKTEYTEQSIHKNKNKNFTKKIPSGAWMLVCCECCVLSGRGICDELITRPEESYRLWCVVVCDLEISWMRGPDPLGGCRAKNNVVTNLSKCLATSCVIHCRVAG